MCVNESISLSNRTLLGSIGGGTDFKISSALSGVNFQLGNNSVSSGPKPKSISNKLYSQLLVTNAELLFAETGLTMIGEADTSGVAAAVNDIDEKQLLDNDDSDDEVGLDGLLTAGVNKSLLFNGSKADCEDKLSTEPQFIGRVQSSSP